MTIATDNPERQCPAGPNGVASYVGETATDQSRTLDPRRWPKRLLTALHVRGDPEIIFLIAKQRLSDLTVTHACLVNPLLR